MPPLERMDLVETIALWEFAGVNEFGEALVTDPIDIQARWVDAKRRGGGVDSDEIAYDATIVTSTDLIIGSIVWRGSVDSIPGTSEVPESDLFEVVDRRIASDLKGRHTRYEMRLARFNNALPTRV